MNPFDVFLINPLMNLLLAYYKILHVLHIPGALGFAIIFLTVTIRMILWPLTSSQLRSTQKMAALKPHLDRIKKDHGHDKVRHQQEVSKLYKEHGVNPLAGCLPLLLQLPVFISLYQVLLKIVQFGQGDFLSSINSRIYFSFLELTEIPRTKFIGFDLSTKPNQWKEVGILILLIPILTGVLQFIQSKMMGASQSVPKQTPKQEQKTKEGKDKKDESMEDTMAQMQGQMVFLMPAMIAFFSYGFPLGLSLYWNTFTVIGIIQQYKIAGAGPLNKYLPEFLRKEPK